MSNDANRPTKPSKEKVEQIAATFEESVKLYKSMVFCVNCGSTSIDQNYIAELRCYNCGNTIAWNGFRFGIMRDGDVDDVIKAISSAYRSEYYDEWYLQIDETLRAFSQAVVGDGTYPQETVEERAEKLNEQWGQCKARIDELMLLRG